MGDDGNLEALPDFELAIPRKRGPQHKRRSVEQIYIEARYPELTCMAWVPDLRTVLAGREDGKVAYWRLMVLNNDVTMSKDCRLFDGHRGRVGSMLALREQEGCFSGGLVVSGGADGVCRVWDPRVEIEGAVQEISGHDGTVTALAQCHAYLASGSTDRTVRLWAPGGTPGEVAKKPAGVVYPWFEPHRVFILGHLPGWVNTLSFDSTGQVGDMGSLFAGDSEGSVWRWKPVKSLRDVGGGDFLEGAAPDEPFERVPADPNGISRGVFKALYIAEENMVVTLAYDMKARGYDTLSGQRTMQLDNPERCAFSGMAYVRETRELFLVDRRGYFYICDLRLECVTLREQRTGLATLFDENTKKGDWLPAADLALLRGAPDLRAMALTAQGLVKGIRICREKVYQFLYKPGEGHAGPVIALAAGMVDDQERILSASQDGSVRHWDTDDMCSLRVFTDESASEITSLAYSRHNRKIITGHEGGEVRLWGVDSGQCEVMFVPDKAHTNTVSSCALVATVDQTTGEAMETLYTCGFEGRVGLWDLRSTDGRSPYLKLGWRAHEKEILACVAWASKESVITAGNEGVIRLWKGPEELLGELVGHERAVTCMSMRGDTLYSGSDDRTVRVWDTERAALLETLRGHESTVVGICVLPTTGHPLSVSTHDPMITGERHGKLILWDVEQSEVIEGALGDEEKADMEDKIRQLKDGLEAEKDDDKKIEIQEVLTGFETRLEESGKGEVSMQRLILDTFTHPEKFRSVAVREGDNQVLLGTAECNIVATRALPEHIWTELGLPPRQSNCPSTPALSDDEEVDEPNETDPIDDYGDLDAQFEAMGGKLVDPI